MTAGEVVIRTQSLTKHYGAVTAVDSVDLEVRAGDIYGFLGANGSGKTTTLRCLLGLVLPTSGAIEMLGSPMPAAAETVLPRVGALVEGPAAYGHLSGRANLVLHDASGRAPRGTHGGGRRDRVERAEEALRLVGLGAVGRRPVRAYSMGMRQRLGLAAALLRQPELLVLDEPTNGLDPQGIREVRELLLRLHGEGTTILLSSHLLAEVEQTCTRIGLLDRGRLVLQEPLDELQAPTGRTLVVTPDPEAAVLVLHGSVPNGSVPNGSVPNDSVPSGSVPSGSVRDLSSDDRVEGRDGMRLLVRTSDPGGLNTRLVAAGVEVLELGPERHTLEDVIESRTRARADDEVPT